MVKAEDSGFPKGGALATEGGGHQPIIWQQFYRKLHENVNQHSILNSFLTHNKQLILN